MKYAVEMASDGMTYVPSVMKVGAGVQAMLSFSLRILKDCYIGITDECMYEVRH
jgi:hypothetical protein